jgi:putative ABC transport system ATP-binding protein
MAEAIIEIRDLRKIYYRDRQEVTVLDGITLDVQAGAFEALMGPSGSGKTTLLNLIAGIDAPTSGSIKVSGEEIANLSETQRARWRARNIGFIFQFYNLMPVLTAAENVELPLLLTKLSRAERVKRVELTLKLVGLSDRLDHTPRQLSGGQQQRVAIARALVADPTIIVADEPTGDLDRKSAEDVLALLKTLNETLGKTIVMVTHDPHAAQAAKVQRRLDKGLLT